MFEGPVFLVGMPRSGTKLLRELLNRHSRVAIPEIETEFLPWVAANISRFGDVSQIAAFRAFHAAITRQSYFRYRRDAGNVVSAEQWHAACRTFDAAEIFEALIRLELNVWPGSGCIWGDKSPSYVDDLPLLNDLFPAGRIIHIVRDPRDYCLSIRQAWGKDMLRAAQLWADSVHAARTAGQALGGIYFELRYEDLLANPRSTLASVCAFLGLEFDERMLELERSPENLGDTQGATSVVAQNRGKYLTRMSPRTLARVEAIAGPLMEQLGYELALARQAPARLSSFAMRVAQMQDAWKIVTSGSSERNLLNSLRFHWRHFRITH